MSDSQFKVGDKGVFFIKKDKDGNEIPELLSSEIRVVAQTCDEFDDNWGKLLWFKNRKGNEVKIAIPSTMFAGDGRDIRERLLAKGAFIASSTSARNKFNDYLNLQNPKTFALCVMQTGWHKDAFILPDTQFGTDEEIYYQSERPVDFYIQKGPSADWKDKIGKYCRGNNKLIFVASLAFSAPLIALTSIGSGGFHLFGPSSCGKSTALHIAASVYGAPDYILNWRATDNGLEGMAAAHNDTLLILDEMGQVAPQIVGNVVYMLANGQGKARSDKRGNARKTKHWRLGLLSSGEINLNEHIQASGQISKAGQEIRLIGIPAISPDAKYGLFENIHEFDNGADFANYIRKAVDEVYGSPFIDFIKYAIERRERVYTRFKKYCANHTWLVPDNADGQIKRAQERFLLVAFAGELATIAGITGWESGEATSAVEACFNEWLTTRGGLQNQETIKALKQVKYYFDKNARNFVDIANLPFGTNSNIAGYKNDTTGELYILTEIFNQTVAQGLHRPTAIKSLIDTGWLIPDASSGRPTQVKNIDKKSYRLYVFSDKIWADDISN